MPLQPAITHVNAGSISASGASAAAYSVTIPAGTGIQPGDLIVVNANSNGTHVTNGMSVQDSVNLTNYTTIKEQDLSSASTRWMQTFFYQTNVAIADGSTITLTPYASNVASSFCVDIFRGTSGAIAATVQGVSPAAGTTVIAPALLTAPPSFSLVLSFASFSTSATSLSPPSPLPFTLGSNRLTTPAVGIAYVLAANGLSTYSVTWTNDSSQSNAAETVAFGALSTTGNLTVPPLRGPVVAASRPLPPRGRCMTVVGIPYDSVSPPPPALHGPVAAVSRFLPPRGRIGSNPGVATAVAPASATLYPLHGPVQAPQPLPVRGRAQGRAGTFTAAPTPAPLYPLHGPVAAAGRSLGIRGRNRSSNGVFSQLGPAFTQLRRPVAAISRPLPSRGRASSNQGIYNQVGPRLTPLQRALQARQPLPARGRAYGRTGIYGQLGPALTPLQRPAAARLRVLPLRGQIYRNAGTRGQLGPSLTPLHQPVQARQPLPLRGRTYRNPGVPGQAGPAVYPLHRPIQARYILPSRGRTISRGGTFSVFTPVSGPPLYPLHGPIQARQPLPQRGHTDTLISIPLYYLGPSLTPLQRPVAARIQPPQPLKGRTQWRQGTSAQVGPPVYPLHGPVKAAFRTLPPKGSAQGRAGVRNQTGPAVKPLTRPVFTFSPAPRRGTNTSRAAITTLPFAQAVLYPRHGPVKAQPPLPSRGRSYRTPPYVTPLIPVHGPPLTPLHGPVRSRILPAIRGGTAHGLAGNLISKPVEFSVFNPFSSWILNIPQTAWTTGNVALNWNISASAPGSMWITGSISGNWFLGNPD